MGGHTVTGATSEAGMRRREQRQAEEAGRWWVRAWTRWAALSARELRWGAGANDRGLRRGMYTDGEVCRKEEAKERSRKTTETGGAGGLV